MKSKILTLVLSCLFITLVAFQLLTTNVREAYQFNAFQLDQQVRRMNTYPPSLARLGYILETHGGVQIIKRLESNFFTVIDFGEYFPARLPYFVAPLFFLGLFETVRHKGETKHVVYAFLLSIVLLTLLGPYAKYGPVLLVAFIIYFALMGLAKAVQVIKR